MKRTHFIRRSSNRVGFSGVSPSTIGRVSAAETGWLRDHSTQKSRISVWRVTIAIMSDHNHRHHKLHHHHHQFHGSNHKCQQRQLHHRGRCREPLLIAVVALWVTVACVTVPTASLYPATGDMSLLTMQRIKSYVDDTCTLDPHCQWTWDPLPNGLRNVSADEAAAAMPEDYLFPPGDDAEKSGQRGECLQANIMIVTLGGGGG